METLATVPQLAILGLGMPELLLIFGVLLLLFGANKLPGLAKGLGQSIKEFKKATVDETDSPKSAPTTAAAAEPQPAAPKADSANNHNA